ncbi:MAG TPA: hypothetical protein VIU02_03775 [Burkholderiales bacterium]
MAAVFRGIHFFVLRRKATVAGLARIYIVPDFVGGALVRLLAALADLLSHIDSGIFRLVGHAFGVCLHSCSRTLGGVRASHGQPRCDNGYEIFHDFPDDGWIGY